MVGVILWCRMKIRIVKYTPSYFGITLDKKQLRLLRAIAADRAEPVEFFIRDCIRKGFANLERYKFSQGN